MMDYNTWKKTKIIKTCFQIHIWTSSIFPLKPKTITFQPSFFRGVKLKFCDDKKSQWGAIIDPLGVTKHPRNKMIHGEKFYFWFLPGGTRAQTCIMKHR